MHSRARLGNICAYSAETTVSRNPQWRTERRQLLPKFVVREADYAERNCDPGTILGSSTNASGSGSRVTVVVRVRATRVSANASAQVTTACGATQLCLDNNYFITGDYVVGGDVFDGKFVNGLATGTITIPDPKQSNSTSVPAGAEIVRPSSTGKPSNRRTREPSLGNGILNGSPSPNGPREPESAHVWSPAAAGVEMGQNYACLPRGRSSVAARGCERKYSSERRFSSRRAG